MAGRFPSDPTLRDTDLFEFYRDGRRFDIDWQDLEANVVEASTPKTAYENSLGLNVVNTDYPVGDPIRYGADVLGVSDSTAAFQAAQKTGSPSVRAGLYRIDGSVDNDIETTWKCERGHQPQRNWFISPGSWPFDDTAGREVRLFKDEASTNTSFFRIRHRDVNILGFPRCDVSDRDTYDSGVVHYDLGSNNTSQNNGRTSIWGGTIEIIVTGNDSTLDDVGNGAKCIYSTWDNQSDFGELTQQRWFVFGMNVAYGAYLDAQDNTQSTYSNNIHGHFDLIRAKQVVYNDSSTGCLWTGGLQNFGSMQLEEAPKAAIYLSENAASNIVDFEVFDITTTPFATDGSGLYGVSALCENYARNTHIIRKNSGSIADTRVVGVLPTGVNDLLYAPIGVIPFSNRDAGTGLNGAYMSALNNNFANAAVRATTFTYDVYDGTDSGIVDTNTAISDAVFANASGDSVDITSALGALPSLSVGAIFTVSDHSSRENNGDFRVTASVTNGYACDKLGPASTANNPNYNLENPSNAAAEAVTVTTGMGAVVTDSVTASIATSAEWSEVSSLGEITKTYGTAPSASFTQNAIDDNDYLELHFDGLSYTAQRMWISIIADGGFEKLQLIRRNSGAVVDNWVIDGTRSADQDQAGLDRFFITGGTADETIIRFRTPRTTGTMIFDDIATTPANRTADGHFVSQLGGQTVIGDMVFEGNMDFTGLPTSDPLAAGRLWNNSGVLTVSAG